MRPLLVVEGEELVESSEPPAVLVVGLEEAFNLAVRLRPSNLAECVLDVIVVEVTLEVVIEARSVVLTRVDEL